MRFSVRSSSLRTFLLFWAQAIKFKNRKGKKIKKSLTICCMLLCLLLLFACNKPNATPNTTPPTACQEHTWGDWETVTPATCTTAGTQKRVCTVCQESETASTAGMHNYENDICTVCARSRFTAGLAYELIDDETGYAVIGIGTATDTDIVIPPTYSQKPVVAIAKEAFCDNTQITSVEIPASVVGIGYTATTYSTSSYDGVDEREDSEEDSRKEIEFPSREEVLDRFLGGGSTFRGCTALARVTFAQGSTLVGIGSRAFQNCSSLSEIVFPASLIEIKYNAFEGCISLSNISLPASLQELGDAAFVGCSGVERISVAEGNTVYCDNGNCLIEIASKTLLYGCKNSSIPTDGQVIEINQYAFRRCTGLTSITIPESVRKIGNSAFEGCTGLTSIAISESVTHIGNSAFEGCTGLTSIAIPKSVTYIGGSAFEGCTGLTQITVSPETLNAVEYFGYKGPIACRWQYDGTNAPLAADDFSEWIVFAGWYTDPTMMNAFDFDRWLDSGHAIGDELTLYTKLSKAPILLPIMIEKTAFETKIMQPLQAACEAGELSARDYAVFMAYYSLKRQGDTGVAAAYPITEKKGIDIYVYNDDITNISPLRKLEAWILAYTDYAFEDLAADHAFVEYEW